MRLKNKQIPRKYYSSIYFNIAIAMFVMIAVSSTVIYYNAENIVISSDHENNKRMIYQVQQNIDTKHERIVDVCKYLYFIPDVEYVMSDTEEPDDFKRKIDILKNIDSSLISTNPFLHSIYIYNRHLNQNYSTYNSLFFEDAEFLNMIDSYKIIPKLKPILRQIPNVKINDYDRVFSYFMYRDTDSPGRFSEAVIVNVNVDYLLGEFAQENSMNGISEAERWGIIDSYGEIAQCRQLNDSWKSLIKDSLKKYIYSNTNKKDIWSSVIENMDEKYELFFLYDEKADIILFKLQPYDEIIEKMHDLRVKVTVLISIFILLAISISVTISRKIYKPIGNLVKQISNSTSYRSDDNKEGEFAYLSNVYKSSAERVDTLEKEKVYFEEIKKEQITKKLLHGENITRLIQADTMLTDNTIRLSDNSHYLVCIIRIDRYKEFEETREPEAQEQTKSEILNAFTAKVSEVFPCNGAYINNDHIATIIQMDDSNDMSKNKQNKLIYEFQKELLEYLGLSVTAALSDPVQGYKEIGGAYRSAVNISLYRLVYGRMSIITPKIIMPNISNTASAYKDDLEKMLIEGIRCNNMQDMDKALDRLLYDVSKLSYQDIIVSFIRILEAIKKTIEEIDYPLYKQLKTDFTIIKGSLNSIETIDEFKKNVMAVLSMISSKADTTLVNKNHIQIANTIADIIETEYGNSELCVDSIATTVKLSPKYINKLFKDTKSISIPSYIYHTRLKKAAEFLETANISVNDVITKVGFTNRTHFYSIFKKQYGLTPKEYAIKKSFEKR